jgi:hypothetical protein
MIHLFICITFLAAVDGSYVNYLKGKVKLVTEKL